MSVSTRENLRTDQNNVLLRKIGKNVRILETNMLHKNNDDQINNLKEFPQSTL